mgnify:CR=1 FL=1
MFQNGRALNALSSALLTEFEAALDAVAADDAVRLLVLTGAVPSNLGRFTLEQALPFILIQGFCVGFLATILYTFAVSRLGSARASTIGSLSPGLTALLAVPVFGESLSLMVAAGVFLTIAGVALSNRL